MLENGRTLCCLLINQGQWDALFHASACRLFVHSHPQCPGSPAQDLSRQTVKAGEWPLTAEPCLPPPQAIWFGPRASLRVERDEGWLSSGSQGGATRTRRSQSLQNLCQASRSQVPPTPSRHSLPQIQKISNNWFGFWPVPTQLTSSFWFLPALP